MKKYIGAIAFLTVLSAEPAWALDMEYYTYGGFTAIVLAFRQIGLIFSDAGYQALFFSVIALGIFVGVTSAIMSAVSGYKNNLLSSWGPRLLLGVALYAAFVVPKGNITVYDPLINRSQLIAGIPDGVVMVAGTLNKIEQGLVDIIDTSGNVEGYKRTSGGLGYNMLLQATRAGSYNLGNTFIGESVVRYINDCVIFELMRPGTTLTIEELKSQSTNFLDQFAKATNPAVWTVYYDSAEPTGLTMSCDAAYANIEAYLSNEANLYGMVKQSCSSMGFNTENVLELQRCEDNLSDLTSYIYKGAISLSAVALERQFALGSALEKVMLSGDLDSYAKATANVGLMQNGISMGMVANEWLPVMRAVFTAVAIGLIPFICLFLPTGIVGKAASLIAGFFIWLSCWGITDAIVHNIATSYALQAMDQIRANNLGYTSIILFPTNMEKALSMFGFVRTAGIMLATVMTSMIVSFGGHALAMMASSMQGHIQSAGTQAGEALKGENMAHKIEAWRSMEASYDNANKYRFADDSAARSAMKMGQTGGNIDAMSHLGGKDTMAGGLARSGAVSTIQSVSRAAQITNAGAERMGQNQGMEEQARAYGNTAQAMVDTGMVKNLPEAYNKMAQVQAYGGTMGGLLGVLGTQGKLDALGDDIQQERGLAEQDKGLQIGSAAQRQHIMDYFEMDAKQYGAWDAGGRVLNEDMAAQLRADGWSGAQAGMKADLGFGKDGEIEYMTGKTETGSYGATYSGGKILESYTEGGYSMTQIKDADGNVLHKQGIKGSNMLNEDRNMTIREHGLKDWSGSDIQRVNRNVTIDDFGYRGTFGSRSVTYDVNETQVSHGTVYSNATMAGMAVTSDGSTSIAKRLLSSDNAEVQDREILTASKAFGSSFGNAITRAGAVVDASSGSIGIKVMGAGGSIDVTSRDERGVNLITAEHSQKLHTAVTHARTSGMTQGQQEAYVANAIKAHGQELNTKLQKATAERYGATAPSKGMDDFVKWIP